MSPSKHLQINKGDKVDYSTFHHIAKLGAKISNNYDALVHISRKTDYNKTAIEVDEAIHLTFTQVFIIDVESFMDEWNNWFTPVNYPDKRIIEFKQCVKTVSHLITKDFKHLRTMRNQLFGHSYRDNDGKSIFLKKNLGQNDAPFNIFGVLQIVKAVQYLHNSALLVYHNEMEAFENITSEIKHDDNKVNDIDDATNLLNIKLSAAYQEADMCLKEYFGVERTIPD